VAAKLPAQSVRVLFQAVRGTHLLPVAHGPGPLPLHAAGRVGVVGIVGGLGGAVAVFGVGPYSFATWKVAISGLYKRLRFRVLGPVAGQPHVLDDTGYSLPCRSESEARFLLKLLESEPAQEFFAARVFWDAKRPITIGLLGQLDLAKLAAELGCAAQLAQLAQLARLGGEGRRAQPSVSTSPPTAAK